MPLFLVMWSLSFGATNSSFKVFPLIKCTWMPYFLPMFLEPSLSLLLHGTVMEILLMLLFLLVWVLFLLDFGVLFFNFILFMAYEGYLHAVNALSMYVNSSSNWSWLEQMFFALCINELITLYLLAMAWWLSHCKYWLVWVGFLYMEVGKLPSPLTVTKVSRKGNDPSALVFSAVNCIFSSMAFICWKILLCVLYPKWQTCHPQISSRDLGDVVLFQKLLFQNAPYKYLPLWGWVVTPLLHLLLVHSAALGKQSMCF